MRTTLAGCLFFLSQLVLGQSAVASTYNIDLSTAGGEITTPGSICIADNCFGGGVQTELFTFPAGSTVDFGTLTLLGFVLNDGGYAIGTPIIGSYGGAFVVSFTGLPFGYAPGPVQGPYCVQFAGTTCSVPVPPPLVEDLIFTDVTQIQLAWTVPYTYVAPVPEPSTRAMLLIGLCGLGWLACRRRRPRFRVFR
jgi:PEP-CTERM motif